MEDRTRQYLIQQRVNSLRSLYEEASGHRDEIKFQLNVVQEELINLQSQYAAQEIELKESYNALGYVYIDASYELEEIQAKVKKLNSIINSPAPEPRYETDGLYCINGIYMCTNHPPRQVLVNDEEMKNHQKEVDEAIKELSQLIRRKGALENYISLDKKHQELGGKIYEAQYNQDKLFQELREADQKVNTAKSNLSTAEAELQQSDRSAIASTQEAMQESSDKSSRWEQLKKLAEEEVRKEKLRLLAMEEFMQEMLGQPPQRQDVSEEGVSPESAHTRIEKFWEDAEKVVEQVGDKLIDRAIDEAREIGAISEQAKKNLQFIKSFGEKALDRLNGNLDEAKQDSVSSNFSS